MAETVQDIFPAKKCKQDFVNKLCKCYMVVFKIQPHIQFQHKIKTAIEKCSKCNFACCYISTSC